MSYASFWAKYKQNKQVPSLAKISHFHRKVAKSEVATRMKYYEVIMWFAEIITSEK